MSIEDRDIQFKNKYLKYKNKYISLKKSVEQNGGIAGMSSSSHATQNYQDDFYKERADIVAFGKIQPNIIDTIADHLIESIVAEENIDSFNKLIKSYQTNYPVAYKIFYDPNQVQGIMFPYYDAKISKWMPFMKGFKNINLLRVAVAAARPKMVKALLALAPADEWDYYPIITSDNKQIKTLQLQEREIVRRKDIEAINELKQMRSMLIQHGFKPEMKGVFNPTPVNPQDAEDWKIYRSKK